MHNPNSNTYGHVCAAGARMLGWGWGCWRRGCPTSAVQRTLSKPCGVCRQVLCLEGLCGPASTSTPCGLEGLQRSRRPSALHAARAGAAGRRSAACQGGVRDGHAMLSCR